MMQFRWLLLCVLSLYIQWTLGKDEKNSGSVNGNELSDTQKVALLQLHNAFRSMVQPQSANMHKMVWDEDLEKIAKDFAGKCIVAHNPERHKEAKQFDWVGENIAWGTGSCGDKDCGDVYEGVKRWFTESKSYNFDTGDCSGKCTLYTQMVWWESNKLGCGAKRCGDRTILVCNYAPGGNYVGQRPYSAGKPCTKCGDNFTCEDNLCVEKTTASNQNPTNSKKCGVLNGIVCPINAQQHQPCPPIGTCPAPANCPNACPKQQLQLQEVATTPQPLCPPPGTCPAPAHCPDVCLQQHQNNACPPPGTCPAPMHCPSSCLATTNVPMGSSRAPFKALGLGEWTRTQARLMQVDSGMTNLVWGIDSTEKAFIMAEENALRPVNPTPITSIRHVTAGGAGVWAIDDSGRIFFRLGTNDYNKRGTEWTAIPGTLKQIDSGPKGTVWGVNRNGHVFRRIGILEGDKSGTGWERIEGQLKYVSCGEFGCWGVRKDDDSVCFRKGITPQAPQGQQWMPIPGRLRMVESGPFGVTVGINNNNDVFARKGVHIDNPQGNEWVRLNIKLLHVTVGVRGVFGVKEDGTVSIHQQLNFEEFRLMTPMPTLPTTNMMATNLAPTSHPQTKQFHPTTVQPSASTPIMFRNDRAHKAHNKNNKELSFTDVVADQSNNNNKNKDNLDITPDMASKILKLIEAKSQSYEKAHKAAAAVSGASTESPNPATSKLKHLLEDGKLPETLTSALSSPSKNSLLNDEENVQLPASKHDEQAKATSISSSHHSTGTEDDDIEYPSPKLPSAANAVAMPKQTDPEQLEPTVKKLPSIPHERTTEKSTSSSLQQAEATPAVVQPASVPPSTVHALTQGVGQRAPVPASSQEITISHELARSCCAVPDSVCAIPKDCAGYIECRGYDGNYKACTRGTVFNPMTNICDSPHNVDCDGKAVSPEVPIVQSFIASPHEQNELSNALQQSPPSSPQMAVTEFTQTVEPQPQAEQPVVSAPVVIANPVQQPQPIQQVQPMQQVQPLPAPPPPPPPPPPLAQAPVVQQYIQQPQQVLPQPMMATATVDQTSSHDVQPRVQPPKSDDDGVLREVWFNLGLSPLLTTLTNNPRFPSSPDEYIILDKFEAPPNAGDGYGQRLSTYYKAPLTGQYVFYLACDNECELWMSPDTEEIHSNLVLELKKGHYTSFRQWHKYPGQQTSREIALQQGEYYFLESFMKEGSGGDDLSVGVRIPDGKFELPISSNLFLVPGENNNPISEPVLKPGEETTSSFINTPTDAVSTAAAGGGYRVEELDPQPSHLVEDILNEKPLINKLQNEAEQEYTTGNGVPGPAEMYLHHNTNSELDEPKYHLLESIKRNHISHKNGSSSNSTVPSKDDHDVVRSIKRDIAENNNVLSKKAKVKLKRALMKHLKKLSHRPVK